MSTSGNATKAGVAVAFRKRKALVLGLVGVAHGLAPRRDGPNRGESDSLVRPSDGGTNLTLVA